MTPTDQTVSGQDLLVTTFIKAWTLQVNRINDLLEIIPEETLLKEIAFGKNTGIYILGHLAAVNDAILPLLGFGKKLYPQLEQVFITNPDKSGFEMPPVSELKKYWNDVNALLLQNFNQLDLDAWLTRHEAVSAEAFVNEPHRNKLNVLISRTTHLSYHLGQLVFLREKKK
jgi:hypothetical protein